MLFTFQFTILKVLLWIKLCRHNHDVFISCHSVDVRIQCVINLFWNQIGWKFKHISNVLHWLCLNVFILHVTVEILFKVDMVETDLSLFCQCLKSTFFSIQCICNSRSAFIISTQEWDYVCMELFLQLMQCNEHSKYLRSF